MKQLSMRLEDATFKWVLGSRGGEGRSTFKWVLGGREGGAFNVQVGPGGEGGAREGRSAFKWVL